MLHQTTWLLRFRVLKAPSPRTRFKSTAEPTSAAQRSKHGEELQEEGREGREACEGGGEGGKGGEGCSGDGPIAGQSGGCRRRERREGCLYASGT